MVAIAGQIGQTPRSETKRRNSVRSEKGNQLTRPKSHYLWGATLSIALVACTATTTDTTESTETTVTTEAPTTTAPEPTTTSAAETTTTSAAPTTTTTTTDSVLDEAEGSGCTPGEGDLPDGEWYGGVADAEGNTLDFDLACWFTGDAAARAAAEDGEESPPPNDYYVRNANPTIRTLTVADDVEVVWYPELGNPNSEATTTFADWVDGLSDRGEFIPGIWVEIEDGEVARIREQWVP